MWIYEKKLEFPVKIKKPNPKMAQAILSQNGGPDVELAASLRYLSQRYHMPIPEAKGILNDIGTEELGPFRNGRNNGTSIMKNATVEQIKQRVQDHILLTMIGCISVNRNRVPFYCRIHSIKRVIL
jgi:spore coat protein JC